MRGLLLLVVLCGGCAMKATPETAPRLANLGGYVANEKALLWLDGAGCHRVVKYADGTSEYERKPVAFCERADLWVKAQAAVPKPAAAAPDGPK